MTTEAAPPADAMATDATAAAAPPADPMADPMAAPTEPAAPPVEATDPGNGINDKGRPGTGK
jgi:hypothetical protein